MEENEIEGKKKYKKKTWKSKVCVRRGETRIFLVYAM